MGSATVNSTLTVLAPAIVMMVMLGAQMASAQSRDMGNGFTDHGPFADAVSSRGIVCTVDGEGRDVVLVWLFDHREGYALAVIDAATGEVEEVPRPVHRNSPFASLLSSGGRYYTYFAGHFMEFDPASREFSFVRQGPWRDAMSMTEDDNGVIWAAIYPDADVVSYDPAVGQFREWGPVSEHPSKQMPRAVAADDGGWLYVAVGMAVGQIVMLDPLTGRVETAIPQDQVVGRGDVHVVRAVDGTVYGFAPVGETEKQWFQFHHGQVTRLDGEPQFEPKQIITGNQNLRHLDLPGGDRVRELNLTERVLVVESAATGEIRRLRLEISGGGAPAMGVAAAPDGSIVGGTYHPMRSFRYYPHADEWHRRESFGQWNVLTATRDRVYIGGYGGGDLLEWDPSAEWVRTRIDDPESNPRFVLRALPDVGRPYTMIAHPDGRHIIYGGRPAYGYTGGAVVLYDMEAQTADIIRHDDLVQWQSPGSLAVLPDGNIIGGTTIIPGNAGVQRAELAELFIFELQSRRVQWRGAPIPDVVRYDDLIVAPDGLVIGIADRTRLFVFDPVERAVVRVLDLEPEFGPTVHQQGPRVFIRTPDARIFVLLVRGIAELDVRSCELTMVAEAPAGIEFGNGGAYLDGSLYFAGGVNLFSWEVPSAD